MGTDLYIGFNVNPKQSGYFGMTAYPEKTIAFVLAAGGGRFTKEDVLVYLHIKEEREKCKPVKDDEMSFAWDKALSNLPLDAFLSWGRAYHLFGEGGILYGLWDYGHTRDKALISEVLQHYGYSQSALPLVDVIYWC